MISIQLKQGPKKHSLEMDPDSTLIDLMLRIEEITDIPVEGQKLILNGRSFTSSDRDKSLAECKVLNLSKIMVLGRARPDPDDDKAVKALKEVERKSAEVERRLTEVAKQVTDLERGHLGDKGLMEQAVKDMRKRCKGGHEEFMRQLETLDGMPLEEGQKDARALRKSIAGKINKRLDFSEDLLKRIEDLNKS